MRNIIFINQSAPKQKVANQLLLNLDKAICLNGEDYEKTNNYQGKDLPVILADSVLYTINNLIMSNNFDNIIFSWSFPNTEFINMMLEKLVANNFNEVVVNLIDLTIDDMTFSTLYSRENNIDYLSINNKIVRTSDIDISDLTEIEAAQFIYNILQ